eukprot:scpid108199/ scgid23046/ 
MHTHTQTPPPSSTSVHLRNSVCASILPSLRIRFSPISGLASSVPPLLTPAAANAVASAAADRTAYRYACHTDKVLHMKRIFLQAKGDLEADGLLPTTSGPAKEAQVDGLLPTAGEHRNAADKNAEMVSTDVSAAAAA